MSVAPNSTPKSTHPPLRRKTGEFATRSLDHQELIVEALRVRLHGSANRPVEPEPIAWKRRRLTSMIQRLNKTQEVLRRQSHARK